MMMEAFLPRVEQEVSWESEVDDVPSQSLLTPEEQLEKGRSELKNGLTDLQLLFLFGKLGGLNDKDAALAAGYSLSVATGAMGMLGKASKKSHEGLIVDGTVAALEEQRKA